MSERVLVSMTSYPGRISNVSKSIWLLLFKQIRRPDEIHLWLAEPEFPNREKDLPQDLQKLLSIPCVKLHWVEKNTYVHKRHEIFKITNDNDCVFLIDDDVRYSDDLIRKVMETHDKFPNCIVCYNQYPRHQYSGRKIIYGIGAREIKPEANLNRWCGQSMIPSKLYPKDILSEENQSIRDITSPVSDECWFQPWTVFYDIPIYHLKYGWGIDLDSNKGKLSGLVSWSHKKDENGYEKRDNWLYDVLNKYPKILEKFKRLFNYG